MRLHRLLVATGLALFGAAVIEMLAPGILGLPFGSNAGYVVGALVLVYAYFVLEASDEASFDQATTPDPEVPAVPPPPRDGHDNDLEAVLGPEAPGSYDRDGLKGAVMAVLTRYEGDSEPAARRQIADGTWTTDPIAAASLGEEWPPRTILERLRDRLPVESTARRRHRRTVAAIATIAGLPDASLADAGRRRDRVRRWLPWRGSRPRGERDHEESANEIGFVARRATNHWTGISLVALVGLGVGLLVREPAVMLAGIVGVGYGAYARSAPLGPVRLTVERSFSDDDPEPDDPVEVTVSITNDGPGLVPDLRVVDGVPTALSVADGSPRHGTALRTGGSATFSYTVTARRGRHPFGPVLALARNLPNSTEQELTVTAGGDSTLTCIPTLRPTRTPVPLRSRATPVTGTVATDSGGSGVAFHGTRPYEAGDPMNRIDWHRLARTGELATLEFQEERTAVVVIVVDVQPSAYVAPAPEAAHAVDRSVAAAGRLFARLAADGHQVGFATLGAADCWLAPGLGELHRDEARTWLAIDPGLSPTPPDPPRTERSGTRLLRRRLPSAAQVIVLTPLVDGRTVRSIRHLDAAGVPATVISPDVTADHPSSQRLIQIWRTVAITDLRRSGIPVIDLPADQPLDGVLVEANLRAVS